MVSEKVGGAEGTKLDDDFRDLERVREASPCGLKEQHVWLQAWLVLHTVHKHIAVSSVSVAYVYTSFQALHHALLV